MSGATWSAVQDALDRGADPLRDPGVEARLGEHPEDLVPLTALLARLEAVAALPASRGAAGRVAAAGLAVAAGLALLARAAPEPGREPRPAPRAAGRLVEWRMTITRATPSSLSRVTSIDGDLVRESRVEPLEGTTLVVRTAAPDHREDPD